MKPRRIRVRNLATGRTSERPSDTPTLDLPADFDRQTSGAALDEHSRAHYTALGGTAVSREVFARPLSWRVRREECLVAVGHHAATSPHPRSYKLCAVQPFDE